MWQGCLAEGGILAVGGLFLGWQTMGMLCSSLWLWNVSAVYMHGGGGGVGCHADTKGQHQGSGLLTRRSRAGRKRNPITHNP